MIKSLLDKYVKAALSEIFIDGGVSKDVKVSMGDLFSKSELSLKNLVFRPDIFDLYLHPLCLVSGHLGKLHVDGIAEAYMGGPLKVSLENIFLFLKVDSTVDVLQAHMLKKIQLEMTSGRLAQRIIGAIVKQCQKGMEECGGLDAKATKKKDSIKKLIEYVTTKVHIAIKTIHIRVEMELPSSVEDGADDAAPVSAFAKEYNFAAVGCTIPKMKIIPSATSAFPGDLAVEDASVTLSLKSLQLYCDYDCDSYKGTYANKETHLEFLQRWKMELHTAILLPFDLDLNCGIKVDSLDGSFSPKVSVTVPKLKIAWDLRQLEVLCRLCEAALAVLKRSKQLIACPVAVVPSPFLRSIPPRVCEDGGGAHLLPSMVVDGIKYPSAYHTLPKDDTLATSVGVGLVSYFKYVNRHQPSAPNSPKRSSTAATTTSTSPPTWCRRMWQYAIHLVLADVRACKPTGKWKNLLNCILHRKEYVSSYSGFLKKSKEYGRYIWNSSSKISKSQLDTLFALEMKYSVATIMSFRQLAMMTAMSRDLNAHQSHGKHSSNCHWITWTDLVQAQLTYLEVNRPYMTTKEIIKKFMSRQRREEIVTSEATDVITPVGGVSRRRNHQHDDTGVTYIDKDYNVEDEDTDVVDNNALELLTSFYAEGVDPTTVKNRSNSANEDSMSLRSGDASVSTGRLSFQPEEQSQPSLDMDALSRTTSHASSSPPPKQRQSILRSGSSFLGGGAGDTGSPALSSAVAGATTTPPPPRRNSLFLLKSSAKKFIGSASTVVKEASQNVSHNATTAVSHVSRGVSEVSQSIKDISQSNMEAPAITPTFRRLSTVITSSINSPVAPENSDENMFADKPDRVSANGKEKDFGRKTLNEQLDDEQKEGQMFDQLQVFKNLFGYDNDPEVPDVVRSRGNSALSAHSSDALPECPSTPTPSGGNAKRYAYLDPVYFNEQVMGISQYKDIHEDKICGIVGKSWKNRQFLDSKLIRKLVSAAIDRHVPSVAFALPDMACVITTLELSHRLPVKDNARERLSTIMVDKISFNTFIIPPPAAIVVSPIECPTSPDDISSSDNADNVLKVDMRAGGDDESVGERENGGIVQCRLSVGLMQVSLHPQEVAVATPTDAREHSDTLSTSTTSTCGVQPGEIAWSVGSPVSVTRGRSTTVPYVLFASTEGQQFFVINFVYDISSGSLKETADLHVNVAPVEVVVPDINGIANVSEQMNTCLRIVKTIGQCRSLYSNSSYLYDIEKRKPVVFYSVAKSLQTGGNSSQSPFAFRNYERWSNLLTSVIPANCSLHLSTSRVHATFTDANVINKLTNSNKMSGKSLKERFDEEACDSANRILPGFSLSSVLRYMEAHRTSDSNSYCDVDIPAMVTEVTYQQSPFVVEDRPSCTTDGTTAAHSCLTIKSPLFSVVLPMELDTFCHRAALALAHMYPFYK